MPIRPTRYVVLDTSHLAGLVADWISGTLEQQRAAQSFVPRLIECGWLPLLSSPQLEELIQHENDDLVDARLRYLWSWPLLAWIRPLDPAAGPGNVLDILAAEASAAHESPSADVIKVRELARDGLLSIGTGEDAIPRAFEDWRVLRQAYAERQENARRIAAIAPWRAHEGLNKQRMADLMNASSRSGAEALRVLERLRSSLANEIQTRGDKRIKDPGGMAEDFFADALRVAQEAAAGGPVPTSRQLLESLGVDIELIGPNDTFGEVMDRHTYLTQLRIAVESKGLPFVRFKQSVTQGRLPVSMLQHAMRMHGQDQPERKGSDLNDVYLLCLALYADLTFVDKRTLESLRRVRQKVPTVNQLLGDVRKASGHEEISTAVANL